MSELPEGFQIKTVTIGGSGRGDELFAPALFQFQYIVTTYRAGLFRRKRKSARWSWVEVLTGNPFGYPKKEIEQLTESAWLMHKKSLVEHQTPPESEDGNE